MASPPYDPAFFLPIVFARGAQNPHTPGGNAAVERCKEAYDSFSPSHTDAALPLGSGAYSTDLLKRQAAGPIFQKLKPVAGAVLWQLTRRRHNISEANMATSQLKPVAAQHFRSKQPHISTCGKYCKQTWPPHNLNPDNCGT